jgi:hypothetical protein
MNKGILSTLALNRSAKKLQMEQEITHSCLTPQVAFLFVGIFYSSRARQKKKTLIYLIFMIVIVLA